MTDAPRTLSSAERLDWLRLIRSENVGPVTFHGLLARFGSATAALEALPDLARRGGRRKPIKVCAKGQAEREMARLEALGAKLVALGEAHYPPLLAQIADAPPLISVLGHGHLLAQNAVAIVGARNASVNGRRFAQKLARDLGRTGLLVVSGLARGIDAAAHAGALDSGTVAILGGGVDVVYPSENQDLYDEIRSRGALVSEVEPGTQPTARHFPVRNRLISGMVLGVVVVEASPRSGSLITARLALDQGREVFAVPGSPLDPRSRGANQLIRQGATLTESADDVLDALDQMTRPLEEPEPFDFTGARPEPPTEEAVAGARATVEESLGPEPVTVDEIIRTCHLSAPVVSVILLELELAGRLERHAGGQVSLIREP